MMMMIANGPSACVDFHRSKNPALNFLNFLSSRVLVSYKPLVIKGKRVLDINMFIGNTVPQGC